MIKNTDISKKLIEKFGLQKKKSDEVVTNFIDIINEGLREERLVKIKGLGTFKMMSINARESVDVNTGERILLEGREKISFTPDATIKELVNKPFAQFETVMLNPGVDFSDIDAKFKFTEQSIEVEADVKPEAESKPEVFVKPKEKSDVVEANKITKQEVQADVKPEAINVVKSEPKNERQEPDVKSFVQENHSEINDTEENYTDMMKLKELTEQVSILEKSRNLYRTLFYITLAALIACVCYNFISNQKEVANTPKSQVEEKTTIDNVANQGEKKSEPVVKQDAISVSSSETVSKTEKAEKSEKAEAVSKNDTNIPDQSVYNQDPRVRLGAYMIMGVDQTITVQKGQTLAGLSKAYLGPGMECYLQAINGGIKEVKEGQTIKIPKLKTKKSLKTSKRVQ